MELSPGRGAGGDTESPHPRWPNHPVSVIVDIPCSKFQSSLEVRRDLLQIEFVDRYDRFGPLDLFRQEPSGIDFRPVSVAGSRVLLFPLLLGVSCDWRLAGLQEAIREGTVPPFKTLCGTTTRQFYDQDKGTNYSQARYLCYHLQERGLLKLYYQGFRKNCDTDPTGYETLKSVLRQDDMVKFQKDWEAEVLELQFP